MSKEDEEKLQMILVEYRAMQEELTLLRESLVAQRVPVPIPVLPPLDPAIDIAAIEEGWRHKVDGLLSDKQILIERLDEVQERFKELRILYETKLETKEEEINYLKVNLMKIESAPRTAKIVERSYRC